MMSLYIPYVKDIKGKINMFSKYDVYSVVQSIYCYSDTNVLINKLHILDNVTLKEFEEEITTAKQIQLLESPIHGRFTKKHLLNIHKFLFENIYPFAGKLRKEQIGKANDWFYPPDLIELELNKIFVAIKESKQLTKLKNDDFFDRLAFCMAELNAVHPFREGNGRSIREFIRLLANHNGYALNWGNVDSKMLLETSINSKYNYKVLIEVLKLCCEK